MSLHRLVTLFVVFLLVSPLVCVLVPEARATVTLTNGYVTPVTGDVTTQFSYYTTFYDSSGLPPEIGCVVIDGSSTWGMSLWSGVPSNGIYRYSTTLPVGTHTYYFWFNPGSGGTIYLGYPSIPYSGPTVNPLQRRLTVSGADHDSPNPPNGNWYFNDGQLVWCTVTSPVTEGNTIWTCIGYTGTGSVPPSGTGTAVNFYITQDSSITWYWQGMSATYDVTIAAFCQAEGADPGVLISPDGVYTPHTFTGLTEPRQFTVPGTDPSGHVFKQWSTGEPTTTIEVDSAGTYTAQYEANRKPVAVLDVDPDPPVVYSGTDVWFYGDGSYDPDGDQVVAFFFDFGDYKDSGWLNYPTVATTHQYVAADQYWARMMVKDFHGLESDWCDYVEITILPSPNSPVAILEVIPQEQIVGLPITFDASQSYDPDGQIEEYYFDYGDGNGDWTADSTIVYSYDDDGEYYARVLVSDDSGLESWSEGIMITVTRTPISIAKLAPASNPASPLIFYRNSFVLFLIEVTDQSDNPVTGCLVEGTLTPPSPLSQTQISFEDGNDGSYMGFYQTLSTSDAIGDYSITIMASNPSTTTATVMDYFRVDGTAISSEYLLGRVEEGKSTECCLLLKSPTTSGPRTTTFYLSSQSDDTLSCHIESPKGTFYPMSGGQSLQTVSIENPEPGNWKYVVYPQQTTTQSSNAFVVGFLDEHSETSQFSQDGVIQLLVKEILELGISEMVTHVLELSPWAGVIFVDVPLSLLIGAAGGYNSVTFTSRTTDGKENLGGIVMDGKAYSFSSSQQIAESSMHDPIYATAIAPLGYTFSHWETNTPNEISFSNTDKASTEIYADADGGDAVAVFTPISSSFRVSVGSPINILISSPDGLRIGYDEVTGSIVNEMSGATYSGNGTEPQTVIIPNPMEGNYVLQTFSIGIGSFEITLASTRDDLVADMDVWTGATSLGEQQQETCRLDSSGSIVLSHDIELFGIALSKNILGESFASSIDVSVRNEGSYTDTFQVEFYVNETLIATIEDITLTPTNFTDLRCVWDSTGFANGNYTLTILVCPVLGELDTGDNLMCDWVFLTIPGDVDGNREVNIFDIVWMAGAYLALPPNPKYNSNCDIDGDGDIDIFDLVIAAGNYGDSW